MRLNPVRVPLGNDLDVRNPFGVLPKRLLTAKSLG